MDGDADVLAVLPIEGQTINGPDNGIWTVHVERVSPPAQDNTRRTLHLRFDGPRPYRLSLIVHTETIYVQHPPGDTRWLLHLLRDWLFSPDLKKSEELYIPL